MGSARVIRRVKSRKRSPSPSLRKSSRRRWPRFLIKPACSSCISRRCFQAGKALLNRKSASLRPTMLCESRHRQRTDIGTSAFWIRLIGSRASCGPLHIMLSCVLLSSVTPFTNRGRASGDQRYLACYVPDEPEELSSDYQTQTFFCGLCGANFKRRYR